ncbi:MAG TPA: hypothetical protein GXX70_00040 [Tepidimicrobium sp.]|nr:hypothetical protein [Tepidimicrobium sp.]
MKFKCEIDKINTLKKGMKITLAISEDNTFEVMKNIYNFLDKPITIEMLIDEKEQLERLRWITNEQRRKIFALIKDIAKHTGEEKENLREKVTQSFIQATGHEPFSLSDCSKELATDFIEYLIMLAFQVGVPLSENPIEGMDDDSIERYLKLCIRQRKCCVCGRDAEIHHVDTIGMGRDRTKVDDTGYRKMALCRAHHMEYHQIGQEDFENRYHVYGV